MRRGQIGSLLVGWMLLLPLGHADQAAPKARAHAGMVTLRATPEGSWEARARLAACSGAECPLAPGECRSDGGHGLGDRPPPSPRELSAGEISLTGRGAAARMAPSKSGSSVTYYVMAGDGSPQGGVEKWRGGERITIAAKGGEVAAFQASLALPEPLEITSPHEIPAGDRPIELTWKPGGEGAVWVQTTRFNGLDAGVSTTTCSFPRSPGRALLPADLGRPPLRGAVSGPTPGVTSFTVEPHATVTAGSGKASVFIDAAGIGVRLFSLAPAHR